MILGIQKFSLRIQELKIDACLAWGRLHPRPAACSLVGCSLFTFFKESLASETRSVQTLAQRSPLAHPAPQPSTKSDRGLSWLQKFHQVLQPQEAGVGN